jgi:uroporphyrinogen-III synthase
VTTDAANPGARPLAGWTVVVTRERPGELGRLLVEAGADLVHLPLIAVAPPADGGAALDAALAELGAHDWLVVTSAAGAERVASAAAAVPSVRLAAVGASTAEVLSAGAGRAVDLVPSVQTAAGLVDAFAEVDGPVRVLAALADRAAPTLADGLRAQGHDVTVVTAYRTVLVTPPEPELARATAADALVLASGSAARSWRDALGERAVELCPRVVVAIGPTTAAAARESGLKVDAVAADHSLGGLVATLIDLAQREPPGSR